VAAGFLNRTEVRAVVIDRRRLQAVIVPQRGVSLAEVVAVRLTDGGAIAPPELSDVIDWHDSRGETFYCVRAARPATGWRRAALMMLTGGALLLALLGVLLPGLPTTPFVLLASYGLMRISRRWHRRLLESRLFGGVLRDWYVHRGISPRVRVKALALLAIVIGVTCLWPETPLAIKLAVAVGGLLGGAYVWHLPTAKRAEFLN
jgi:uncharacterized membrane protein YbaN (DUF454 family)